MLTEKLSTFCANSIADFFPFTCKETDFSVCNIVNVLLPGVLLEATAVAKEQT